MDFRYKVIGRDSNREETKIDMRMVLPEADIKGKDK